MCIRCHIQLERYRSSAINPLRSRFGKDWKNVFGVRPGKETFNSVLFSCIAQADAVGRRDWPQLLAGGYDVLSTLEHELSFVWPCTQAYPQDDRELEHAVAKFIAAVKALFGHDRIDDLGIEDVGSCAQKYKKFRATAFSQFRPLLQERLEAMNARFAHACEDMEKDFEVSQQSLAVACPMESLVACDLIRVVKSHESVSLSLDVPVETSTAGRTEYKIRRGIYERLRLRFVPSKVASYGFRVSLWCLLHRYQAIMGPSGEGGNWHLATPPEAMGQLSNQCGVSCECFASPINATTESFCSAFIDTDAAFGSKGGFFSCTFTSGGSFEVGPPYNRSVVSMVTERLQNVLQQAEDDGTSLAFVCVFPSWHDHFGINQLKESRFVCATRVMEKHAHRYRSGMQHYCKDKHLALHFDGSTLLLWLASSHAPTDWLPTTAKVAAHVALWQ